MTRTLQAGLELGIDADDGSKDDRIWRRQQKAKGARKTLPPAPSGKCCGTCAWWVAPDHEGTVYGACMRLSVVARGKEWEVMSNVQAIDRTAGDRRFTIDRLATAMGYTGCTEFAAAAAERAA